MIISGPQLLAHLKVGPIIVGFFLTTNCCHDRWLIGIKGEGLALCDREAEYENKVQIFPQISWVSGFSSLWVGLLGSMGGKKLLSQILTISRQSSFSYDLRFDRWRKALEGLKSWLVRQNQSRKFQNFKRLLSCQYNIVVSEWISNWVFRFRSRCQQSRQKLWFYQPNRQAVKIMP